MWLEQSEPGRLGRDGVPEDRMIWGLGLVGRIWAFTLNEMSRHWSLLSRGTTGTDLFLWNCSGYSVENTLKLGNFGSSR